MTAIWYRCPLFHGCVGRHFRSRWMVAIEIGLDCFVASRNDCWLSNDVLEAKQISLGGRACTVRFSIRRDFPDMDAQFPPSFTTSGWVHPDRQYTRVSRCRKRHWARDDWWAKGCSRCIPVQDIARNFYSLIPASLHFNFLEPIFFQRLFIFFGSLFPASLLNSASLEKVVFLMFFPTSLPASLRQKFLFLFSSFTCTSYKSACDLDRILSSFTTTAIQTLFAE